MHIELPHHTNKDAAVARVKQGLMQARPHLAGQATIDKEEWNNSMLTFAFTAQGKQVNGTLRVTDTDYIVDAKLPLMWRIFEGKIEKMVKEQAAGMLGRPQ